MWVATCGVALAATVFAGYLVVRPEFPNPELAGREAAFGDLDSRRGGSEIGVVDTFVARVRGAIPASLTSPIPSPWPARGDERLAVRLTREALEMPPEESARARELFGDALAVDPTHVDALRGLAARHLQDEDDEQALLQSSRCLASAPTDRACRATNLLALARFGKHDQSEVESCVREDPNNVDCLLLGIVGPLRRRDLPTAHRWLERIRAAAPDAPWLTAYEADIADLERDPLTALAKYKSACARGVEYGCQRASFLDDHAANTSEESGQKQP